MYREYNDQKKQTMNYKTLHKNYRLSNTSPLKPRVNSGAPDGQAVPAPLVAGVTLILNEMKIMGYGNRAMNIEKGRIFQESDMKGIRQILIG